jgi:hypothetical protein
VLKVSLFFLSKVLKLKLKARFLAFLPFAFKILKLFKSGALNWSKTLTICLNSYSPASFDLAETKTLMFASKLCLESLLSRLFKRASFTLLAWFSFSALNKFYARFFKKHN